MFGSFGTSDNDFEANPWSTLNVARETSTGELVCHQPTINCSWLRKVDTQENKFDLLVNAERNILKRQYLIQIACLPRLKKLYQSLTFPVLA